MAEGSAYEQALSDYTSRLRTLFAPLAEPAADVSREVTRGMAEVRPDVLAERAERLADSSGQVGGLTTESLEAPERDRREAAEVRLLTQSLADMEAARGLLEIADHEDRLQRRAEERGVPIPPPQADVATRAVRAAGTQQALASLAEELDRPLGQALTPLRSATRAAPTASIDLAQAKTRLAQEIKASISSITRQATTVGGRAISDLALMDMAAVRQGLSFLGKEITELIDKVASGLRKLIARLVSAALRLVLNAYRWVTRLLGGSVHDQAKKQVDEWLEELKQSGGSGEDGIFAGIVRRIYGPDEIEHEITAWLGTTEAAGTDLDRAGQAVRDLADRYKGKSEKVETLLKGIALVKKIPLLKAPQAQVAVVAVTLGLALFTVFSGYDHLDSDRIPFLPDRVEGIRETVQKALGAVGNV
jgi:hypothetical protein